MVHFMDSFDHFPGAAWITPDDKNCQSPILCRQFRVQDPGTGTLYITGLGYFEARLNGRPVTRDRLIPVASDYEQRDTSSFLYPCRDHFTHRIYYCRYDVSSLLQPGTNLLEIQLGNGWYRQTQRIAEGKMPFSDRLKALYALHLTDEVITSDGSEQWYPSEIVENQLFLGEVQDARIQEQPAVYRPVCTLPAPNSTLTLQTAPADRIVRTIRPKCIYRDSIRSLWDVGENCSAVVGLWAPASPGTAITLRFAEEIRDNRLDFTSVGGDYICASGVPQIMTDTFICGSAPHYFLPKFVWHCFRYFEISGPGSEPEVQVIHSDVPVTASFSCSSEGWQFLYDAFLRTQLANMHGGFPSDCPHRERLGYTGDGQLASAAGMLCFDSRKFYEKWIQDILDCQDTNGHVQHTAPFMGGGGGPGGWGNAIIIVPYLYFRTFADKSMLEKTYPAMEKWIGYLLTRCEDDLLVKEEEGGWCLGDWCTLDEIELPEPFVNTCWMVYALDIFRTISEILGKDTESCNEWITQLRGGIRKAYYEETSHSYIRNRQGAHAFAWLAGLADKRMLDAMAEHYRQSPTFDTGFLGTFILIEALLSQGYGDVLQGIMDNDAMGTYLYMKRVGGTTIFERWWGSSLCHPMFGSGTCHIFNYLLGIRPETPYATYQDLVIAPVIPTAMQFASGKLETVWGTVAVSWEKKDGNLSVTVEIPEKIHARLEYGSRSYPLDNGTHSFTFPQ